MLLGLAGPAAVGNSDSTELVKSSMYGIRTASRRGGAPRRWSLECARRAGQGTEGEP
jgi:hypothetical protein